MSSNNKSYLSAPLINMSSNNKSHRSAPSRYTSSKSLRRSTLSHHSSRSQPQSNNEQETQPQYYNEQETQPQYYNEQETQIQSNNEQETQPQYYNEQETQPQSNNQIMSYNIFIRNAEIIGALTDRLWSHHNTINDKEKKQIEDFFSNEIARLGADTFETTYNKAKGLDESIQFAHKQIKSDNLKRKYKYVGGKSKKKKKNKRKKTKKRKGTSKRRSKY